MKIGIKYCGGCNPRYSRQQETEKLKTGLLKDIRRAEETGAFCAGENDEHKDTDLVFTYDSNEVCDFWLVIHGCPAACGKKELLKAKQKIFEAVQGKDFVKIKKELLEAFKAGCRKMEPDSQKEEKAHGNSWTEDGRKILYPGQQAFFTKVLDEEVVAAFARLTGDFNSIHLDPGAASESLYRKPVVHGMLTASLISTVMGMKLPGPGTVFSGTSITFDLPVFWGDTITAEVVLEDIEEYPGHYRALLKGRCVNQDGLTVVQADCSQILSKRKFYIKEKQKNDKS